MHTRTLLVLHANFDAPSSFSPLMFWRCTGIGMARAKAIVHVYPSFKELLSASKRDFQKIVVRKSPLGEELAEALYRALH